MRTASGVRAVDHEAGKPRARLSQDTGKDPPQLHTTLPGLPCHTMLRRRKRATRSLPRFRRSPPTITAADVPLWRGLAPWKPRPPKHSPFHGIHLGPSHLYAHRACCSILSPASLPQMKLECALPLMPAASPSTRTSCAAKRRAVKSALTLLLHGNKSDGLYHPSMVYEICSQPLDPALHGREHGE